LFINKPMYSSCSPSAANVPVQTDSLDGSTGNQLLEEKQRLLNQLNENVKMRRLLQVTRLLGEQNLLLSTDKVAAKQPSLSDESSATFVVGGHTEVT